MTDMQMWEMIVGFLSATFVIPVVQQPRWSTQRRAAVTFIYSVLVGLGTAYLTGAFTGVHNVHAGVTGVLSMLIAAVASYHGFAQPIGIAPWIETATSGGPPPGPTPG